MRIFQNYHRHSMYTNPKISDSTATPTEYAKRAVELGHGILSSAEHGWQGNYYETQKIAKEYGLKPLIGAEAYFVKDRLTDDKSNCHIFIGARNENGRQALNDVLSEANISGFYRQPRLDIPLILSLPKDDVIVTTACLAYWKYEDIDEITELFYKHFEKNFYLEVQYHNTEKQRQINSHILELHNKLKIPLIMGCDSHYINPKDAQTRTDFLNSKGLFYEDEEGWYLDYPDGDTAYNRFAKQCVLSHSEICEAMDNTNVFLEIEEYNSPIFDTNIKMPSIYPNLNQDEKNKIYEEIIFDGWEKYKKEIPEEKHQLYLEEIEKEIQTVKDTKTADYFIDNYHIIKKGKENGGWLTKSGRGSAVSFITNKLLGFTEVDRIAAKIHMYPERFMSTTRILQSGSLPDIDFNCANVEPFAKAQQEVLGEDHAYPMLAYGTMKKSSAWKLYAKSQDIPFEIANAVSTRIRKYEEAVKHAEEEDKDNINIDDYIGEEFKETYEKSKEYLGLISSYSIAPCSYLLYQGSIRKEIGLIRIKQHMCCIMDGHWAEECHFLKNDLLKVRVVDLIYRTFHRLNMEPPTVSQLLSMCPPEDKVWDVYAQGCTLGINQCEQPGTTARVSKYSPKNISELGAFVAAIRPGFKSMYKIFENRQPFAYGIKAFDDLIQTEQMPNSFLLYQEQEMAALNYAGIDMSDCYTAIKNIAKKRVEKVLTYKETFINGMTNTIVNTEDKTREESLQLSNELWTIIEDSSRYSFNASHSYCVALDSLYCAYLKAHYPLEFYEVLLTLSEEKGDKDKMNAIKEEAEDYFKIKFAPLRFGEDNRSIKANHDKYLITNCISAIKGFGTNIATTLYECSLENFTKFTEVLYWLNKKSIKSSKINPLIEIDYFQEFGSINELKYMLCFWDLLGQGTSKNIRKEKIQEYCKENKINDLYYTEIIKMYGTDINKDGSTSPNYKIGDNAMKCMFFLENCIKNKTIKIKPPTMKERIQYSLNVLGYVDVMTNKESDRRRLLITDVSPISSYNNKNSVWAYRIGTKSLGSGKSARITVKKEIYDQKQINKGDIIYAVDLYKNQAGYWYLVDYCIEKE